jgi:Protein of unknown function (DUF2723)
MNQNILKRIDVGAVLSFIIPLFVYLLTLAPTVTFFDSGEFVTAITSYGSAHSPGYPLFISYAKLFTWLPLGNVAFRVNFATAISAAAACYGVYLLVCHLLKGEEPVGSSGHPLFRKGVALGAALSFGFTPRLWLQSNHDKPYPLVAFIAAMVLYLLLLWRDHYREGDERPGYVYLGAFLCGLAFGAHQTIILLLPAYAYLLLSLEWRLVTRVKEMILMLFFGLLGFSVYLHIPVRASQKPLLNWGDASSLSQFLWHFLRQGYPVEKPPRDLLLLWDQINAYNVPHEFTWVGMALMLMGMVAFFRKRRDEVLAYVIGLLFFLLVIVGYFNTPGEMIFLTEEFFTPLYLFSAVFMGLGIYALLRAGSNRLSAFKVSTVPVPTLAVILALGLPTLLCARNYYENDQHENFIAFDYASNTLRSLPQHASLFTWGDSGAFPLWYLQGVERMREDLAIIHTPHLVFPWYLDGFPELFGKSVLRTAPMETMNPDNILLVAISEQIGQRPVFVDFSTRYSVTFSEFVLQQWGICYRLEPKRRGVTYPPDLSVWQYYTLRGLYGDEMPFRDLDTGKAILIYGNAALEEGELLMRLGKKSLGMEALGRAVQISPELRISAQQILLQPGVR